MNKALTKADIVESIYAQTEKTERKLKILWKLCLPL